MTTGIEKRKLILDNPEPTKKLKAINSHSSPIAIPMGSRLQVNTKKDSGSQKKLVIKTLKVQPKLPENFEEETWSLLKSAIHAVHNNKKATASLEELYKAAEDMCYHKMASSLYSKLQQEIENHVKFEVTRLIGQSSNLPNYLTVVNSSWKNHCENMLMIRSIFLYLDRTYVIQTPGIASIWDMGLRLYREHVISNEEVEKRTVNDLLEQIERERRGESVDRTLLKNLIRMFVALQIYSENFEKPFIEATQSFYQSEGVNYMREMEVPEYLKHVEQRIHEENDRVIQYLDQSTRKTLIQTLEKQLLEVHVDAILNKGFQNLMENNRQEDLRRMFSLFNRINSLDKLKAAWNAFIKTKGSTMVADVEKEKTLVQDLLEFKANLDITLAQSFFGNENFAYALKEAHEGFINSRANKPAELIAKFIDQKLKTGNKGMSEEELEQTLDKVMVLFRYINGKDVFEAFYKKDLAKRLLLGKSASVDAEKYIITKLKSECGSSFTSKLEGMFKDIDLSKDIMVAYKQSPYFQEQLKDIDLHVHVLTTGYWPPYTPVEINLPKQMAEIQELFKKFYLNKHNGRRLMWQNSLGHCQVKVAFPLGRKELYVSLYQTVVLLLFENSPEMSQKDIEQLTGMEKNELKRTLQSLACGKVKVLSKSSKSRDVEDDDIFSLNKDFKHKLYKIKINAVQIKETTEENQKTTQNVMQDRQYQIDAAIVRIMKTRKILKHNILVSELLAQLKFPVKPGDLKKRIESLIDREYLEREVGDSQTYKYLA